MSVDAIAGGSSMMQGMGATDGASRPQGPPPGGKRPSGPPPGGEAKMDEMMSSLDEETQEELQTTISEMRESGASFEDVKSYVDGVLEENGVEVPQMPFGEPGEQTGVFINTVA